MDGERDDAENLVRQAREIAEQQRLPAGCEGHYRMWEDLTSPYSAKVRAYLRYKQIPYRRMRTTFEVYLDTIAALVGAPIIPVVLTPEGEVLQDSTPMLAWLEARHPEPATVPDDPRLAMVHWLLEDFADEYLPRLAMHTRWGTELNRAALSRRIARNFSYGTTEAGAIDRTARMVLARQSGFDQHLGLGPAARDDLDAQILELLAILERHFERFLYLLGDRPSIADFALYGPLWAHLFNDPGSAPLMEQHGPLTCRWLEEITELGDLRGGVGRTEFGDWLVLGPTLQPTLAALLEFVAATYVPLGRATAKASAQREKRFEATIRGVTAPFSTHHYRAWSFEQVQRRYEALDADTRAWCDDALTAVGVLPGLLADGIEHNGLFDGLTPPVVRDGAADNRLRHLRDKAAARAANTRPRRS